MTNKKESPKKSKKEEDKILKEEIDKGSVTPPEELLP